jgi:RNA polymerase subunit RPABC4/transcription elongation factor Spt4
LKTKSYKEETVDKDFCPECQRKDFKMQLLERDHAQALKEKDDQINQLTGALEKMEQGHTHFTPEEYENCPNCGPALQKYVESKADQAIAGIIANKEEAAKIAKAAGLELMPEKITLGPGIIRRLRR